MQVSGLIKAAEQSAGGSVTRIRTTVDGVLY
jgi:hypothetical protein